MTKVKSVFRGDMDWSKFAYKVGKQAVFVIIAGLASVYGDNPTYLLIAPILTAVENYVKHA